MSAQDAETRPPAQRSDPFYFLLCCLRPFPSHIAQKEIWTSRGAELWSGPHRARSRISVGRSNPAIRRAFFRSRHLVRRQRYRSIQRLLRFGPLPAFFAPCVFLRLIFARGAIFGLSCRGSFFAGVAARPSRLCLSSVIVSLF